MAPGVGVQQFEQLYQENLNPIYRYVYGHVKNREAAEDLTSQIFLKAVRSLDLEQRAHNGSAWLFRVARTTMHALTLCAPVRAVTMCQLE